MSSAYTPIQLFGAPCSLYTGKVRSFLRKQGIAYQEHLPSHTTFQTEVLAEIKRFMNPVVQMPDGRFVQDTADIIDALDAAGLAPRTTYPVTPRQRIVALILNLYGSDGLTRAAMHYRWSYRDYQEQFLQHEFGLSYRAAGMPAEQAREANARFMSRLNAYLPAFGITADTAPVIETCYEDVRSALDAHFREYPFALGDAPCIADYSLMASLYAHLGRDPYPCQEMKRFAPSLYRWVERMNAPDDDIPDFPRSTGELPSDDGIPDTLLPVLRLVAQDYLPEVEMVIAALNTHLAEHPDIHAQDATTEHPRLRWIGSGTFRMRGVTINSMVQPYTVYLLQRIVDAYAALPMDEKARVDAVLAPLGLLPIVTLRTTRRIERKNHLEVWGEQQP